MRIVEREIVEQETELPVFPVWAREIHVERRGVEFHVHGRERFPSFPSMKELPSKSDDLMKLYRRYDQTAVRASDIVQPPHLRFANAVTEEELVSFLRTFGPVDGTVMPQSVYVSDDLKIKLTVVETLAGLRVNQLTIKCLLRLIQLLQERANYMEVASIVHRLASNNYCDEQGLPTQIEMLSVDAEICLNEGSKSQLFDVGHAAVCELLNKFPSVLVGYGKGALELPSRRPEGILSVLYFMLRKDYLTRNSVRSCEYFKCSNFFRVARANARFCSEECSLRQRQHEYWIKKGKKKRKDRLLRDVRSHAAGKSPRLSSQKERRKT